MEIPSPRLESVPKPEPVAQPDQETEPSIALVLTNPPVSWPMAPMAIPVAAVTTDSLLERVRKLEEALAEVQNLHGIEQRVADRVATQLQIDRPARRRPLPPFSRSAVALLDAGKHLLPSLGRSDAPPGPPPPANASNATQRSWLLWETIAEARAIVRMYLDPRYTKSWLGRTIPLVLTAAFVLAHYWVPFAIVGIVGPIIEKAAQLLVGFVLFKVLGHEARRYRETAPDLPPSLRL